MHAKLGCSCIKLHCRTIVELSIASLIDYRFIASTFFKAVRETGEEFYPKPLFQSTKKPFSLCNAIQRQFSLLHDFTMVVYPQKQSLALQKR